MKQIQQQEKVNQSAISVAGSKVDVIIRRQRWPFIAIFVLAV